MVKSNQTRKVVVGITQVEDSPIGEKQFLVSLDIVQATNIDVAALILELHKMQIILEKMIDLKTNPEMN